MSSDTISGYAYHDAEAGHTQGYLWEPLLHLLQSMPQKRVFELGCGNGALAAHLHSKGFEVVGVDPSEDGIRIARQTHPTLQLHVGSAYDDLATTYGQFPAVVSLEVVEHVYYPRKYAKCVYNLLEPGGTAIISTPYHSYLKNLALALTGKMDAHFTALWDYGHIKFSSRKTLTTLLEESGLKVERFCRVGRVPILAKSMIVVARRPR